MLLSTPKETALADLGELCRELADFYRDAAALPEAGDLRPALEDAARRHDDAAAEVEARIRAHGALPRMPDPEREALAEAAERLKRLFTADHRDALLEQRMQDETRLLEAAHQALALGPDEPTRACVERVRVLAEAMIERLVVERAAHGR